MNFRTRNIDRAKLEVHLNNVKNNLHTLQKTRLLNYRHNVLALFKARIAVNEEQHAKQKCTLLENFIRGFDVEGGGIFINSVNNEK
jgi:methyl coenzyme M reductase subunit C